MEEKKGIIPAAEESDRHSILEPVAGRATELVRELISASGREAINRILDLERPERMIQGMNRVDFFWLVKKIGEEESLPLLKMASLEQWEYLLDMDLWQRDRLDLPLAAEWFGRLHQADPERFLVWLVREGESLADLFFFKNLHVEVRNKDEAYDLGEEFITLDGIYYLRIRDKEHRETIKAILQDLAKADYLRYQALLVGLMGVLPTELEEGMYRLRNVRLAEDGFLPFEEALSIYAYKKHDALKRAPSLPLLDFPAAREETALVPVTPLFHAQGDGLLTACTREAGDPLFLDRIRLEFAGLCNQVLSADGLAVRDMDTLLGVCRKAAGFINLGLEKASGGDLPLAEEIVRSNPLVSLFRVGFGLALELRWGTERWLKEAWFVHAGFKTDFWGDEWGGTLAGILQKRPRLFSGAEGEIYQDYSNLAQIEGCRSVIGRLMVLDRLLKTVTSLHPPEKGLMNKPSITCEAMLFTFWARERLSGAPAFNPLTEGEVKALFRALRAGEERPPYLMALFKEVFVEGMKGHAPALGHRDAGILEETLSLLWDRFVDENAWVAEKDLKGRFVSFFLTKSPSALEKD